MALILFIDDDPLALETMTKAVQVFGHQALNASSGQQGLELAAQQRPDIIFIDMRLPDMDGLTLLKRLKEQPASAGIPILVLSAGPELDAAERVTAAGARAYLCKPIRLQTLIDTIQQYTSGEPNP
ncbi:MAG: response regulator [Chloroflexi bacterium]|jgi:CheY-like chemotaxis protein|nr:response regulator [Chloroflexota bacterium]